MVSVTRARLVVSALGLGIVLSSCGSLQESAPDHFDYTLPKLFYDEHDALIVQKMQDLTWWPAGDRPGRLVPDMVCAGSAALATDCCAASALPEAEDCTKVPLACDLQTNRCALLSDLTWPLPPPAQPPKPINLVADIPSFRTIQGRIVASTTLTSLATAVYYTGARPPVRTASLYIGPQSMTSPSSQGAAYLASVSLDPGTTTIVPGPAGQQAFSSFASDYQVPFRILLTAQLVILHSDTPIPSDTSVSFVVTGQARAWY